MDRRKTIRKIDPLARLTNGYENIEQNMTPEEIDEVLSELNNLVKLDRKGKINHVQQNISQASIPKKVKEIHIFLKNQQQLKNSKISKDICLTNDLKKRQSSINRMERWDDFRIRKETAVDGFILVKKN